jgi:hypothetical protein
MEDNKLQFEEGLFGDLPSSFSSSILTKTISISVKDVDVYECIHILKALNQHFDLSIVAIKKRRGIS